MLLSMTGHGEAVSQNDRISVSAEVRSVNNRHLKVSVRCPDAYLSLESDIEKVVRKSVSRGTINFTIKVRHLHGHEGHQLDVATIKQYWEQVKQLAESIGVAPPTDLTPLLSLPGIIQETDTKLVTDSDWPLIEEVVVNALGSMQKFRIEEGQAMADELNSLARVIEENLISVISRAPSVVVDYRNRLMTRINDLLEKAAVKVGADELLREYSLFADRCDITEEITRLRSHLQQYRSLLTEVGSVGRKLEFLGQEIYREINTIGSKANDVEIAHRVVDMKSAVEKMREIIQNIE